MANMLLGEFGVEDVTCCCSNAVFDAMFGQISAAFLYYFSI